MRSKQCIYCLDCNFYKKQTKEMKVKVKTVQQYLQFTFSSLFRNEKSNLFIQLLSLTVQKV